MPGAMGALLKTFPRFGKVETLDPHIVGEDTGAKERCAMTAGSKGGQLGQARFSRRMWG